MIIFDSKMTEMLLTGPNFQLAIKFDREVA